MFSCLIQHVVAFPVIHFWSVCLLSDMSASVFLVKVSIWQPIGADTWQPLASKLAVIWSAVDQTTLQILYHVCWWFALGLILAFIPYFPKSKHAHLFMGPLNYLTETGTISARDT